MSSGARCQYGELNKVGSSWEPPLGHLGILIKGWTALFVVARNCYSYLRFCRADEKLGLCLYR